MSDFYVYGAVVLVMLIALVLYVFLNPNKECTVPGLSPTTQELGNFPDIERAGSLHEFLTGLHKQFGPIASFWMGPRFVVSIASPELFKQHQHIFNRPPELFRLFEPMIGHNSLQYANNEDGKGRRNAYDKSFSHDELQMYYPKVQRVADSLLTKWSMLSSDEQIPLGQEMFSFSIKAALTCLLGDYFHDDKEVVNFKTHYDIVWAEMEKRQGDHTPPPEESPRGKAFNKSLNEIKKTMKNVIEHRRKMSSKSEEWLLIDRILDHNSDAETSENDCVLYLVASFHTTGNLLTWAIYFLATNKDIEQKVYNEVTAILGKDDEVNYQNLSQFKYLRWVLDETMRHVAIGPWGARFQNVDSELGGYKIPKNTPVLEAFGVVLQDGNIWSEPRKFDPDRFSPERIKDHPTLAFSPFGFAGKPELFRVYEPLFGANCIQYANGSDGRARRAAYDKSFSQDVIKMYFPKLQTTPVIHALGVSLQDEKTWPLPNKFDPERFTPEHSKDRPPLAFSPFGFAGKRQCPAHKFAYQEASVCLATLIKK